MVKNLSIITTDVHAAKLLNVNIAQGESSTTMAMSASTL